MSEGRPRRLRRGVVVGVAVVVVVVLVVGLVLLVRSRRVERSAAALCTELADAQGLDQSLSTLDPTTLDPRVAALRRAARVAPSDVSPSVSTLADFVSGLADAVDDDAGDPRAALTAALEARQDRVDAVTAAGTAVEQWAAANCGLDLGGLGGAGAAGPGTTTAPAPGTTP